MTTSRLVGRDSARTPPKPASAGQASAACPRAPGNPCSVLVIEDQAEIADLMKLHLQELPSYVMTVSDGLEGLVEARRRRYDLIVLDIRLPGCDGLRLCQILRVEGITSPILVVSAKGTDVDRIVGLEVGADDYLPKPFNVAELVARAKALLRRGTYAAKKDAPRHPPRLEVSDFVIDPAQRRVVIGSKEIALTAKEFDLLYLLACHPGRVFTRAQILETLSKSPFERYEHNVNNHVNRLRLKIEPNPREPRYVLTVWGVGYKFAG